MSSGAKSWVAIILVIILLIMGWIYYSNSSNSTNPMQTGAPVSTLYTNTPPQSSASNNTSDIGISQDMTSLGSQMNGMESDSASVNQ